MAGLVEPKAHRPRGGVNRGLRFIEPLCWEEVLTLWEADEGKLDHWIAHYTKRGFSSWRDWRCDSVAALQPERLSWRLYQVVNPQQSIPLFRGGPFRSWVRSIYQSSETPLFAEIVKHPKIAEGDRVNQIIGSFPPNAFMLGLKVRDDIVIIDGMHRCCAITLAAQRGIAIDAEVTMALADFAERKIPLLGQELSPT